MANHFNLGKEAMSPHLKVNELTYSNSCDDNGSVRTHQSHWDHFLKVFMTIWQSTYGAYSQPSYDNDLS